MNNYFPTVRVSFLLLIVSLLFLIHYKKYKLYAYICHFVLTTHYYFEIVESSLIGSTNFTSTSSGIFTLHSIFCCSLCFANNLRF